MRLLLAALLVALGLPVPAASAAPAAGVLVVSGPGGSVRIARHPYRLQVLDPQGHVRLSEVANPQAAPTPYASTDAVPLGSSNGDVAPLAAPLVLTVGTAQHPTYPATPFSGNLLVGASTGVQYSATDVLTTAPDGHGGLALTVGSNAPTGEQFTVDVRPDGPLFRIDAGVTGGTSAVPPPTGTLQLLGDSFDAPAGDAFHGFGGRHDGVDLRGTTFDSWVQEEDFSAGPVSPQAGQASGQGDGYLFPNGSTAAYYVQSQFETQRYGFLADQTDLLRWRVAAADAPTVWQLTAAAGSLHEVVAPSDPTSSIPALTSVTGRMPAPPAWALQPMIDRGIYLMDTEAGYQAKVVSDLDHLAAHDVPDSAYRIEGWATLTAADLAADLARVKRLHLHALLYYRSFASADGAGTESPTVFTDAVTHGYGATTAGGAPYLVGGSFGAPAVVVDFTNPAARAWFAKRLTDGLDLGADGFMVDFGEQVAPDMHFADGETGATMHDRYPVLYQQLVAQTVQAYEEAHPGRQIWYYDRTGYSGSARYEAANFPGDETTDFSRSSGLASLTSDMLNRGVGGAYGFSTDIGGYEDVITGATTSELLLRWAEWSVLSPTFRLHGSAGQGTHVPWGYDAATLAAYRRLAELRQRVAPLVGRLWAQSARTGQPLMTPLWLAYPRDATATKQDQEWLLGPDVLAAPVVTQGATSRTAYLPAGCWTYVPTGRSYGGQRSVTVAAPVATLSWFTRCGATPFAVAAVAHPLRPIVPTRSGSTLPTTGGLPLAGLAALLLVGSGLLLRRGQRAR